MPVYLYKARNMISNKVVKGEVELATEKQVTTYLYNKQLMPLSVKEKTALNSDLGDLEIFQGKIKMIDINFFCKQFAAMVHAGISIGRALGICAAQTQNKSLKKHLTNIHDNVNTGKTLSEAAREEGIFPNIMVSMIECGEASGKLDMVLNRIVEHFDKQLGVMRKIKKALTYPLIVIAVIIVAVAIIMVKVVPAFTSMFEDVGVELPTATKMVIAISDFFVNNILIILVITLLVTVGFIRWATTKSGKFVLDRLALQIPIFGPLNKRSITSNFANTLSMLVTAGLPMLQAMEITKEVVGNTVAQKEIDECIEKLRTGSTLNESILGSKIHPPLLYNMISIGEETGALDDMLAKVGVYFDEEVAGMVDRVTTFIEPALTILIAVVVGGIMLAVILPTFTMATSMM